MPTPTLSVSPTVPDDVDVVVVGSTAGDPAPELLAVEGYEWLRPLLGPLGATGAADELVRVPAPDGGPVVAVAGVGDRADAPSLRLAVGSAIRQLAGRAHVAVAVPATDGDEAAALLEGAGLGAYAFRTYRNGGTEPVARVTLVTDRSADDVGLERIRAVVEAVATTKDLVNTPPNDLHPEAFADLVRVQAERHDLDVRVWDEDALEADGFGGILGVGRGSSRGPRLVRLEHAPEAASAHLALVGKGITFDSGGLSLKPGPAMVGMKGDMAGAAAVYAAMLALARLAVPVRVTAWLCLAENMPSGSALRPNDVLRLKNGTTVEVLNTDAEGRLVLADGLAAASADRPDAIVDVATLTGAQIVALGDRTAGLMGDEALVDRIRAAANEVDEAVWPMPLPRHLRSLLKSDVADMTNAKLGKVVPGMLLAGVFLEQFVGRVEASEQRIPWAHLDIAGPADNAGAPWGFTASGATGAMVRTLVRLGEGFAAR